MWKRELGVFLRLAGCPWHPGQKKAVAEWRVGVDGKGQQRRLPLPLGRQEQHEVREEGGLCSPYILPSGPQSSWGSAPERQYSS